MKHVRIDEGIKRGNPGKTQNPQQPAPFVAKLPNDPQAIKAALEAYESGATQEQIAKKYGVTQQAIYGWLLGNLGGEEYGSLVTRVLTARVAMADTKLEKADSPIELARAREIARNSRQDLERRRPSLYGHTAHLTVENASEDFGERLRRAKERLIEGEAIIPQPKE